MKGFGDVCGDGDDHQIGRFGIERSAEAALTSSVSRLSCMEVRFPSAPLFDHASCPRDHQAEVECCVETAIGAAA